MISHEHRCIFIHVPKTAGESIETMFSGAPLNTGRDPYEGTWDKHLSVTQIKELYPREYQKYFKFSIVRNPWDRFISMVLYRRRRWGFTEDISQQIRKDLTLPYFHRKSASNMLCHDGSLAVDFVVRFERLQDDMKVVWGTLGLPNQTIPHLNVSAGRAPYWDYFDNYSREFIRHSQRRDIELFGYDYEGKQMHQSPIQRILDQIKIRAVLRMKGLD